MQNTTNHQNSSSGIYYIELLGRFIASALGSISVRYLFYTHKSIYGGLLSDNIMVDNNEAALLTLNSMSAKGEAKTIDSFDFSDMYTALSHEQVLDAINSTVHKVVGKGTLRLKLRMVNEVSYAMFQLST